jgi:hypothetical protein
VDYFPNQGSDLMFNKAPVVKGAKKTGKKDPKKSKRKSVF